MIKYFSLAFITILISTGLTAQNSFNISASGFLPFIPKSESGGSMTLTGPIANPVEYIITEQYDTRSGGEIFIEMEHALPRNLILSGGTGISYYHFRRSIIIDLPQETNNPAVSGNGNPIGSFFGYPGEIRFRDVNSEFSDTVIIANPGNGETQIVYFNLPFAIEYPVLKSRLKIGVGMNNSLVLYSTQKKEMMDFETRPVSLKQYTDKSSDGLSNYLFSGTLNLQCRIYKNLWLTTAYAHHFTPLYDEKNRRAGDASYRTVKLGLKYCL